MTARDGGSVPRKASAADPGAMTVRLQARGVDLDTADADLPLTATIVVDAPTATTGERASTTFGSCAALHGGVVVRCK
jgi:hypothetical protein